MHTWITICGDEQATLHPISNTWKPRSFSAATCGNWYIQEIIQVSYVRISIDHHQAPSALSLLERGTMGCVMGCSCKESRKPVTQKSGQYWSRLLGTLCTVQDIEIECKVTQQFPTISTLSSCCTTKQAINDLRHGHGPPLRRLVQPLNPVSWSTTFWALSVHDIDQPRWSPC